MTPDGQDRRHRWAETCENVAHELSYRPWRVDDVADLREIAAYLRAPETEQQAKEEG